MTMLDTALADRAGDVLVIARRASVPLVQVRAMLPGPAGPAGRLAAACLLRRSGARERLDDLGVTAEVLSRPDGLLLSACAEPGATKQLLDLLAELLRPGDPPPHDVLAAERARLSQLDTAAARDPGDSTRREALSRAFGAASPYAEVVQDLDVVTPDAVQEWQARADARAVLVVCGDVDPAADWGDPPAGLTPQACPVHVASGPVDPRWRARDRPGSAQTTLRGIAPFARPGSAERAASAVTERLLGGSGKGSRLVRELREKRGFGYHPGTSVVDLAGASHLLLEADVATEVTGEAVQVVDDVLASLTQDPPAEAELESARRGVIGDLARATDAQGSLADLLLSLALAGRTPDELPALARAVRTVTADEVAENAAGVARDLHGAASADAAALVDQRLTSTWA